MLEICTAALFAVALGAAVRRGRLAVLTLLSAAAFGVVLEQGSQVIFETYEYSPDWSITVDRAPVAIALAWALIITGAMRITDAMGVRQRHAPFVDATLAIMLDLAFDAVAIRMGLWTWRGIAETDGWFGVPAGNLYTWLFITLSFSLFTRALRSAAERRRPLEWLQLIVPLPAFWLVLVAITALALFERAVEPPPGGWLHIFGGTLLVFLVIAAWGMVNREPRDLAGDRDTSLLELRLAFFNRLAIHAFFLTAFLVMGLAARIPALLLVAVSMLALEVPLAWFSARRDQGTSETEVSAVRGTPKPQRYADRS